MIGKDHDKVLRDIRKYVKVLEDSPKLATPNFFIESTYKTNGYVKILEDNSKLSSHNFLIKDSYKDDNSQISEEL